MVQLLLAHGANLLLINRNGNTPCAIAADHNKLQPETCQLLQRIETEQLKAGGTFHDYRTTNGSAATTLVGGCKTASLVPTIAQTPPKANAATSSLDKHTTCIDKDSKTTAEFPSLKKLSKKLRDSAGKQGKANVVREIIKEAGNQFPKVSLFIFCVLLLNLRGMIAQCLNIL